MTIDGPSAVRSDGAKIDELAPLHIDDYRRAAIYADRIAVSDASVNAMAPVVPAKAGTHTPRLIVPARR